MNFPIDLGRYRSLTFDLAQTKPTDEQREQLAGNVQDCSRGRWRFRDWIRVALGRQEYEWLETR